MLWVPVLLASLSRARHGHGTGAPRMRFRDGSMREHHGVPGRAHGILLAAPSKGKHFHEGIKGKHGHTRTR